MMLKCIIVDDQPQTPQTLKNYIKKIPFLELTGIFATPKSALLSLKNNPADLIFLEIRKPIVSASLQLPLFHQKAMVILLSASNRYAMDGFEMGAIDYLLKPVPFERFYRAVEKAYKIKNPPAPIRMLAAPASLKGGYIFIKESTRLVRVELDDIYYVMGLKNYVSIQTKSHRIVSLQTMKQMEDLLPTHRFARVHRSYFVALDKIISVEKQQIHIKDKIIPIGNIYLSLFMKRLAKISN
jgi:DNA-binding LytR/AlgR family response regulator